MLAQTSVTTKSAFFTAISGSLVKEILSSVFSNKEGVKFFGVAIERSNSNCLDALI